MSKEQATQLADALERLMPLIERGTKGFVFAADKAGEVIADKALLRDAPNLLRRWPDGEPVAWIIDAAWGKSVSLERPDFGLAAWKAPAPKLVPLYTAPPAERIAALEAALAERDRVIEAARNAMSVAKHFLATAPNAMASGAYEDVLSALRAIEEVR